MGKKQKKFEVPLVKIGNLPAMNPKELHALKDEISFALGKLPEPPPVKYDGPSLSELLPQIEETVRKMMKALHRRGAPADGVVCHLGLRRRVGETGWAVTLDCHDPKSRTLRVNAKYHKEYLYDVYGISRHFSVNDCFLKKVLKAAAAGVGNKSVESWRGSVWISGLIPGSCPPALDDAQSRYVAFKDLPGYDSFDRWFEEGMKK